jgi:tetratricopeptide (TPR) repeat protein
MRIATLVLAVAALGFGLAHPALAAGGGGGAGGGITRGTSSGGSYGFSADPVDPYFAKGKALVEAKRYQEAMPYLQQAIAKDPKNADAYNLMGYATRKSGNANGSLQYYNQALAIDPKHLGANEYIGEAYLQLDRPLEAAQHLARLDSLCTFGCTEYRMLKAAMADYKAGRKPTN